MSTVAVGRFAGVMLLAVCVSRRWLLCRCFACRLAVVRGSLPVMGGSLAVEHCRHPIVRGVATLVSLRTTIVPAGEFLTDAGAYVALDGCSIAVDRLSIAVVGCALARVAVVICIGDRAHIRQDPKASDRRLDSFCEELACRRCAPGRAVRRSWCTRRPARLRRPRPPVLDAAGGGYRAASMRRAAKAPDDWTPTLGGSVGVQNAAKGARVPGRRPNRSLPRAPCMQAAGGLEPARSPQRAIRSCAPQT